MPGPILLGWFEPFLPFIDIIVRGLSLSVYSRAELPRTVAIAVALLLSAAPASVVAREFRAADTQSEDYPTVEALRYMGRLIAERSGGRHQIRVFHSRQLGEEKETIEQTRAGAIDLNRTNVAPIGAFVPAMNVLAMPFLFRSIEHLQKVLDGPIGIEILNNFEPYGFVGLAFYDSGARSIYDRVRPIHLPAEDRTIFREAAIESSRFMRERWKNLEARSRRQAEAAGVVTVTDFDRKPFEAAMAEIYVKAERNPAAAELIERIRKVE